MSASMVCMIYIHTYTNVFMVNSQLYILFASETYDPPTVCVHSFPLSSFARLQLERLAKRLKKEKVSVDVVVFGEQEHNEPLLCSFVDTINGKDGSK